MRKLGILADDFTGATDIAGFLASNGMMTIQTNGVPSPDFHAEADSYVVSLKSRSSLKTEAVRDSLAALQWLQDQGCNQFYFKYCSTFDSTEQGNIGPVTDALMQALGTDLTVICPALPVNGRTVYRGYLFVYNQLLHESGMRNHPVTPMKDSKLSRLMESQSSGKAETLSIDILHQGVDSVRRFLTQAKESGYRYVVLDAIQQDDLDIAAQALLEMPLLTGASGLAVSLAKHYQASPKRKTKTVGIGRPKVAKTIVFAGSCSEATNRQVSVYLNSADAFKIEVETLLKDRSHYLARVVAYLIPRLDDPFAPLVYATVPPEQLARTKETYPSGLVEHAIEEFFGNLAVELKQLGVRNYIIAGGETSGNVVQRLGISAFSIGPQIDPGIPWVKAVDQEVYLALKSGNFGADDFFLKAQKEMV
ncbi:3-oxo-tetronate kinase [Sphaerochaeta sp.]|uniref:3-oxo-tetronate kinase n=1 Tax=Sphaerochaeta sp. TaxID=1972642 RepID=UPI002FCA13C8